MSNWNLLQICKPSSPKINLLVTVLASIKSFKDISHIHSQLNVEGGSRRFGFVEAACVARKGLQILLDLTMNHLLWCKIIVLIRILK